VFLNIRIVSSLVNSPHTNFGHPNSFETLVVYWCITVQDRTDVCINLFQHILQAQC